MRYFKTGGLHFLRLGRCQLSFCICRRKVRELHIAGQVILAVI